MIPAMTDYRPDNDDDGAEERALARIRARKAGIMVAKLYAFGAAVTFIILLLTADLNLGQLIIKSLFWPNTLGQIALKGV